MKKGKLLSIITVLMITLIMTSLCAYTIQAKEENLVPVYETSEIILPKAQNDGWAILNLTAVIFTSLLGLMMTASFFIYKTKNEDDDFNAAKCSGFLFAILSLFSFFHTQDIYGKMTFTDHHTLILWIIAFITCFMAHITRTKPQNSIQS